jgi:AraC family transcriptional regulator, exoenzyme S synthesis regulatory protein ExsA
MEEALQHNILYSCVSEQRRATEQFATDHALSFVMAGEVQLHSNHGNHVSGPGTIGLFRKNQLVKATKIPSADGRPCRSLNIFLTQEALRKYGNEKNIKAKGIYTGALILELTNDRFLKGFFDSLLPYAENPGQLSGSMAELKTKEAIELLLRLNPGLKDFLFDFSEPHKIDLEAFMNQNFTFNVRLSQFAKLTGRSLATFKRDFKKTFVVSPEKWLLKKRLEEAHFLIAQRRQHPSAVYLDVGFENLSHFSHSFKKFFGYNPSSLI